MNKLLKLFLLLCVVMILFSSIMTATADFGPKDQLTVYVLNPPDELYYLDLLTQEYSHYNNIGEEERESLNQEMLQLLYSLEDEGWKPALIEGTGIPMWGDLIGKPYGNYMVHTFSYFGVPDTYRIIIVTESGTVTVSDVYTRFALQSSVIFDYASDTVSSSSIWLQYIMQFFMTLIPTILIEGVILILFGFKLKENIKIFLFINLVTQILLTVTIGTTMIQKGSVTAFIFEIPVEIVILIAETTLFRRFLIGRSKLRATLYGISANLASWIFSLIVLSDLYFYITDFVNEFLNIQ